MAKSKKASSNELLYAVALIIMGAMLLFGGFGSAQSIVNIVIMAFGIVVIVLGVMALLAKSLIVGVVEIAIGIIIIVLAWTLTWVAFLVAGIALIVYGVKGVYNKKNLLSSIGMLVAGGVLIALCFGSKDNWAYQITNILFYVAGGFLMLDGVLLLLKK